MSGLDRKGVAATVFAFVLWGVVPLYWHALKVVPSLQIIAHRIVWSALLVLGWLALKNGLGWWREIRAKPRLIVLRDRTHRWRVARGRCPLKPRQVRDELALDDEVLKRGPVETFDECGRLVEPRIEVALGLRRDRDVHAVDDDTHRGDDEQGGKGMEMHERNTAQCREGTQS